jgi:hypothetical protein
MGFSGMKKSSKAEHGGKLFGELSFTFSNFTV